MTKTATTPPISINGKAFYDATTTQRFMARGVALSAAGTCLGIDDILSDDHLDLMSSTIIPKLIDLNVNMIRVYQVNPRNSHVKVMHALAGNGIYVMVGLATSTHSVKQMTGEYSQGTFDHAARLVDEFRAYDNTLCFSVGNEVEFPGQQAANLKDANPGVGNIEIVKKTVALELEVAQAMRSFARDVKNHIRVNNYRRIPVGCAMQDGPQVSWESTNPNAYQVGLIGTDIIAQYYASGDAAERMDYIGINSYRYVPGGPMSAYDGLATEALPLPVPVILTETGGLGGQRTWEIVPKLYTRAQLYTQLSGQVAFQMLEEGAGYGLFDVSNDGGTVTLTATASGGAGDLSREFATAAKEPLKPIATTPTPPTPPPTSAGSNPTIDILWPAGLLPLKTYQSPNATITVENYATADVQIVQSGKVMGTVGSAVSSTQPTCGKVNVVAGVSLSMQGDVDGNWDMVCSVPAKKVANNITVRNNVPWGGVCPISG